MCGGSLGTITTLTDLLPKWSTEVDSEILSVVSLLRMVDKINCENYLNVLGDNINPMVRELFPDGDGIF